MVNVGIFSFFKSTRYRRIDGGVLNGKYADFKGARRPPNHTQLTRLMRTRPFSICAKSLPDYQSLVVRRRAHPPAAAFLPEVSVLFDDPARAGFPQPA
jgi:hypothetical protein